jgi:hypothetical protein
MIDLKEIPMFKDLLYTSIIDNLERQIDEAIAYMDSEFNEDYINEFGEVCKATKASMDMHKAKAKDIKKEFKECKQKNKNCMKSVKNASNSKEKSQRKTACKEHLVNCLQPKADAIEKHKEDFKKAKEKSKEVCIGKKLLKGVGNLLKKGAKKAIGR